MKDLTSSFQEDDRVDFEKGCISLQWHIEDVEAVEEQNYVFEPELMRDEKMNVLLYTLKWHDATCGVTWDTLDIWLNELYGDRMKKNEVQI